MGRCMNPNHPEQNPIVSFDELVSSIVHTDTNLSVCAAKAVNQLLTLRNWLIGFYIAHYELNGSDRAEYGENLLAKLSSRLKNSGVSNTGKRQLYNYLRLFQLYPQMAKTVAEQRYNLLHLVDFEKVPSVTALLEPRDAPSIVRTLTALLASESPSSIVPTASTQLAEPPIPEQIITRLAYSHFEELIKCDNELKRRFYEIEAIQGGWSVRELKRQIASLYFERTGLSTDKQKLASYVAAITEKNTPELTIRDPLVFEFLGLKPQAVMYESDLEKTILANLQEFLLELGHGFCFEAQQKRILIGDEHFFIDLVFYNRILKCHLLIELKVGAFSHEHLGQLNTYVNWYKANEMRDGDNPPIGLLLCTQKNQPLVEYALAGMNNQLFVSKYLTELPSPEEIARFLNEKLRMLSEADSEATPIDQATQKDSQ